MGVAEEPLLGGEENVAPSTVNTIADETPTGCCGCCPGGTRNGFTHEICECCPGEFNASTCCLSVWCPCIVFYKTAEELNLRAAEMKKEPSWFAKNSYATGILGAIAPVSSFVCSGSGAAVGGAAGAAATGAAVGGTISSMLSTIGTCAQVGLTCHFSQEIKKVKGINITEDVCMSFCCALCCTPCRMTQTYHTLTNDDVGCGCCCLPRKAHAAME